ncbi:MAG: hypothetical protein WCT26_05105 [Candidatus Buchananbacteria bacterium]|jgi:hypothetical protein
MTNDPGPQKLSFILKAKPAGVKPPAYEWQDLALKIIAEFGVPDFKRNSVFQVCKKNSKEFVEKAMNETKELCKTGEKWKYFFKVASSLNKPKE